MKKPKAKTKTTRRRVFTSKVETLTVSDAAVSKQGQNFSTLVESAIDNREHLINLRLRLNEVLRRLGGAEMPVNGIEASDVLGFVPTLTDIQDTQSSLIADIALITLNIEAWTFDGSPQVTTPAVRMAS